MAVFQQEDSSPNYLVSMEAENYDTKSDSTWGDGETWINDAFTSGTSLSGRTPDTANIGSTYDIEDTVSISSGRVYVSPGSDSGCAIQVNGVEDYYVQVEYIADIISGTADNRAMLAIEMEAGSNNPDYNNEYYGLFYDTYGDELFLRRYTGGSPVYVSLDSYDPGSLARDEWVTLKLAREGNDVVGYLDGTERVRATDTTYKNKNFLAGFGCMHHLDDANNRYDNFKVVGTDTSDDSWVLDSSPPAGASGGEAMEATGIARDFTDHYTRNAKMVYQINFVTTGTHYVWLRMYSTAASTYEYAHISFDGVIADTHDRFDLDTSSAWTWVNTDDGSIARTISVGSTGVHTLEVYMSDPSLYIDKIVITKSSSYTPTGTGPAESGTSEEEAAITGVGATGSLGSLAILAETPVPITGQGTTGTAGSVDVIDVAISFTITGAGATAGAEDIVAAETGTYSGGVSELRMILSAKKIVETISAYTPTASPAGIVTLPITRTFASIQDIKVSFHDIGSTPHYYEVISTGGSIDNENPQVKLYDATGPTLTNAKISATVIGY